MQRPLNDVRHPHSDSVARWVVFCRVRLWVGVFFCRRDKDKGQDTCYSAAYMSQTRDQQRCTNSEVEADWHEPMEPQRIMWPSIARANGQLDPRCS